MRATTSAPDGYTLLVGSSNELVGTRVVNPAQRQDGVKDFTPIGMMTSAPVVNTSTAARAWAPRCRACPPM